jgi:hypothetical protein
VSALAGIVALQPDGAVAFSYGGPRDRRRRVGALDVDATRPTWAVEPERRGYDAPARIVLRGL